MNANLQARKTYTHHGATEAPSRGATEKVNKCSLREFNGDFGMTQLRKYRNIKADAIHDIQPC